MADIILARPQAGATQTVPAAAKARYVMQFPTDQATLERPEGSDNLLFKFDDGSSIELKDFYKQHNKEEMPEFEVDGQLIAGADFFEAFGPDLMPAAGPGSSATGGGRFHDYANADLMDGLNHLNRLDLGFENGVQTTDDEAAGGFGDDGDAGSLLASRNGGDTPDGPTPGPVDHGVTFDDSTVTVMESPGKDGKGREAGNVLTIDAPDGVYTVAINGVTVVENGMHVAEAQVPTGMGVLKVTDFEASTGELSYEYVLGGAIMHDKQTGEAFEVTVTDWDGDTATGNIVVNVEDSVPTLDPSNTTLTYIYGTMPGNGQDGDMNSPVSLNFMTKGNNKNVISATDPNRVEWEAQGVSVDSCRVVYDDTGAFSDYYEAKGEHIAYSSKYGLTVSGGRNQSEISFNPDVAKDANGKEVVVENNESQAVVIQLDHLAHGMEIELGRFRTPESDPNNVDQGNEKAMLLFYRVNDDGTETLVDTIMLQSATKVKSEDAHIRLSASFDADGNIVRDYSGMTLLNKPDSEHGYFDGFNKVIIAAAGYVETPGVGHTTENSDFVINSISFPTLISSDVAISVSGSVAADAGEDGVNGALVQFDGDSFSAVVTDEVSGEPKSVTVIVKPSGDGTSVVATYGEGKVLFDGNVDEKGSFVFNIHEEFKVGTVEDAANKYDLKFVTAPDNDSDAFGSTSVSIITTSFDVSIVGTNGGIVNTSGEEAVMQIRLDTSTLEDGTILHLTATGDGLGDNGKTHDLQWVSEKDDIPAHFIPVIFEAGAWVQYPDAGFSLTGEGGVFTWTEPVTSAENLKVTATLTTKDGTTRTDADYVSNSADEYANRLLGGAGDNILEGGDKADKLYGGDGSDTLYGGGGSDILSGDGGNDELHGGAGSDLLYGGAGNDTLYGDAGNDTLYGGEGADKLYGGADKDVLYGDAGDDVLYGDAGSDTLYGGEGADKLYGGADKDVLYGDAGDDVLHGDADRDTLYGGEGNDELHGGDYWDKLYGNEGNDTLYGGQSTDELYGGAGDDYLNGGYEGDLNSDQYSDTLEGGAGNDIMVYDSSDKLVDGGEGIDFLLTDNLNLKLDTLLTGSSSKVSNVEVLVKGTDLNDLTNLDQLADRYGIELGGRDDNGNAHSMTLTDIKGTWEHKDGTNVYSHMVVGEDGSRHADLTLETASNLTLTASNMQQASPSDNTELQQATFELTVS